MEIKNMQMSDIEQRSAEIEELLKADDADVEALSKEVEELEARKAEVLAEVEQRKQEMEEALKSSEEVEPIQAEERTKMDIKELRNSKEYIEAFAEFVKTGDDKEVRSLLTENASGTLPVPTFVADIVAEAFKESKILNRVQKMFARGNLKVPFEYAAPIATAHVEGTAAQAEEALAIGYVNMIPTTWKKWVGISDEALDNQSGENLLRYIYSEVARGIVKAREKAVCDAILAAPQTATATAPAVAKTGSAKGDLADLIVALGLLGEGAEDPVIILSNADYAMYKGMAMSANYAVDPFDGLTVIRSDYATVPIVGDLKGVMENFVRGDEEVQIKLDDKTRMKEDIVDILGRMPTAIAVVGNKYFAKVAA